MVSFNIISSPEQPIVLGLPWFKLHIREIRYLQPRGSTHKISTISLHQLCEEGRTESMFVFTISVKPSNVTKEESTIQLPKKYHHYANVFYKVKASTLPYHQPYDYPIDLQPRKEPPLSRRFACACATRATIEVLDRRGRPSRYRKTKMSTLSQGNTIALENIMYCNLREDK